MQIAKSLVMNPASMVSMHTASRASENTRSSVLLSSFARWRRPRVHAKMEAAAHKHAVQGQDLVHSFTYSMRDINKHMFLGVVSASFFTDGIGGGLFSLLVLSVVASHCAMGGLRLNCASIRADQHTGHHTQGAVA